MKRVWVIGLTLLAFVAFPRPGIAGLKFLETARLRLVYLDGLHSYIAPHVARCFENSYTFHQEHWNDDLGEKVTVFLHDLTDQGNGAAKNIPDDLILVALAPFSYTFETMPANERMNTIMNHELVHIYAMDRPATSDRFFRTLFFGKPEPIAEDPLTILYDYLASPRRSAPRWYHEGIAVFLETWMAGGYGRAQGAYDEMVFRTMIRDSARFYDPVGLEAEGTKIDFHVGVNSYLYGTRFMSYLARQHGPQKVMAWVNRSDSSGAYFIAQFRRVFGTSLDRAWKDWINWEESFQQTNLATIRQYATTETEDLTSSALGSVSRAFFDRNRQAVYAAVNYPGRTPHIAAIDITSGRVTPLEDVKNASLFFVSSMAYDESAGTIFYTTDNYGWRDLCLVNVENGDSRTLLKDARVGDLAFNRADQSIWGVRHFNGISAVVRIPLPYTEWNLVRAWPYGSDIYDLDIAPDGRRLSASLAEVSGRQTLIGMDIDALLAGDTTFEEWHDFGNSIPQNFTFSDEGRYLYGASYYTGVSNIFRYDLQLDSMEALSNCETGLFRPIPISTDSLIAFRYTAKGFIPTAMAIQSLTDINAITYLGQDVVARHPVLRDWVAGSPGDINLDSLVTRRGNYSAFASWNLVSLYPIVEGYKSYTAAGIRLNFSDWLGLKRAHVAATYSPGVLLPKDERWHARAAYSYQNWNLNLGYNAADFYDLFGPTKTSRKGYTAGLEYEKNLIYDEPRSLSLRAGATGYSGLERLPDYQNVATTFDQFGVLWGKLKYENLQASLGAVDHEKGHSWEWTSSVTFVTDRQPFQTIASLNYGVQLPVPHSSLWLRTAGGWSPGDREDPFANFYFGGFGNNWVDHRSVKRYREWYSFPGLSLNQAGGSTFTKATVEWALPPLRFRRLGFPALYCSWARAALFASGLATNLDDSNLNREYAALGAQIDFQFQLLSQLKLTFSLGQARAYERHQRGSDETMVSLRVL